jgi:hypothetical protein
MHFDKDTKNRLIRIEKHCKESLAHKKVPTNKIHRHFLNFICGADRTRTGVQTYSP